MLRSVIQGVVQPAVRLAVSIRSPVLHNVGDALAAALSPKGEDYAFYDFSDVSRLFPDQAGSSGSPAAFPASGSLLGLVVGREKAGAKTLSQVLATQPELILNGSFAADTNWAKATGWTIAGGKAVRVPTGSFSALTQPYAFVPGKNYVTAFDLALRVGTLQATFINVTVGGTTKSASGSFVDVVTAVAGNSTLRFQANETADLSLYNVSLKELPAHLAKQTAASFKPQFQSQGAKFDGSDDNLLTDISAQAGANCIIAQIAVPATIATTQIVAGLSDGSGASRFQLTFNSGSGILRGGVGNSGEAIINGGPDLRGTTATVCLACDGSTVTLMVNDALVYTGPQSGSPATGVPLRLGCRNKAGSAEVYFGGHIKRLAVGRTIPTLAQFQAISRQWAA